LGVFYGLLTAVGFGTADFMVTGVSRRIGPMRAVYLIQVFGLIALAGVAVVRREPLPPAGSAWVLAALFGLVNFGGMYFLYRSFTVGSLSVCSPIAASYAVVTGLLALASGERPPRLVLLGALILVMGVIVVARGSGGGAASLAGVPEALTAAGFIGVFFWGMDGVTDDLGWLWPVIVDRVVMLCCAFALLVRAGAISPEPEPGTGRLMIAASGMDTLGLVAFNLGIERAFTTSTSALGSLYSAIAVVLAWLFLRERLARAQWAGIGAILTGILLVSL
jgi:drug/metabolite transporter (DMT)-like permease